MRTALHVSVSLEGRVLGARVYEGDRILIGRGADCDVQLEHGSVAHRHARIERQASGYLLRDLESAEGIEVADRRVDAWPVQDGDRVRIAVFELLLRVVPSPEPAAGRFALPTRAGAAATGVGQGGLWLLVGAVVALVAAIALLLLR